MQFRPDFLILEDRNLLAAPTLDDPGSQYSNEGDSVSLQLSASDPDYDTLTYSASNLPPGLSLDSNNGLISGTIDYSAVETGSSNYSVTVGVDDGNGGSDSKSFTWNVNNTNRPPQIAPIDDQFTSEGDSINLTISGSDPDSGTTLNYTAYGLPAGLTINSASSAARWATIPAA